MGLSFSDCERLGDELLSAARCARLWGVTPKTWRRWAREGRVPAPIRVASTVRWRRSEIEARFALAAHVQATTRKGLDEEC